MIHKTDWCDNCRSHKLFNKDQKTLSYYCRDCGAKLDEMRSANPKNSGKQTFAEEKSELLSAGKDVLTNHKNYGKQWAASNRGNEWLMFSEHVFKHVEKYTVPQYGDLPDDNISTWTAKEVIRSIGKRAARFGRNQRADQDELDLLKIAHEACIAYYKLKEKKDEERD